MALYSLFSSNVEVQYKSYLLSKATLFTFITTLLNLTLPFLLAYRSKGFWLKSYNFFEQPTVYFTYNYILIAETDDPSQPIICSDVPFMPATTSEEQCTEFQVEELDIDNNGKNDLMKFKFKINTSYDNTITSFMLIIALDVQLKTTCPLHMQSLGIIEREFSHPISGFKFYGDLKFYQKIHLPCYKNHVDIMYNNSILSSSKESTTSNIIDNILDEYFLRKVTTHLATHNSRVYYGQTSEVFLDINIYVPEMEVRYKPSLLQELKWAWPQYLSLVIIFYWIFNKIKCFVFNNRLVMAWKDVPWKKR